MRIYRVHLLAEAGTSFGFEYFRTKTEALASVKNWKEQNDKDDTASGKLEKLEFEISGAGLLHALRRYATHPDNG